MFSLRTMKKQTIAHILGATILLMGLGMSIAVMLNQPAKAQEQLPQLVELHVAAIKAAQQSNAVHMPELDKLKRLVQANDATALSSRTIICRSFPDYCKGKYLNPEGSEDFNAEVFQ